MSYLANTHVICQYRTDARNLKAAFDQVPDKWARILVAGEVDIREIERTIGELWRAGDELLWQKLERYYVLHLTMVRRTGNSIDAAIEEAIEGGRKRGDVKSDVVPYHTQLEKLPIEEIERKLKQRNLERAVVSLSGRKAI